MVELFQLCLFFFFFGRGCLKHICMYREGPSKKRQADNMGEGALGGSCSE